MTVGADPAEEKMIAAIIEANDPVKRFNKVCAVDHISPPGVVFGFLGPNGVGKTTTITGPI